METTTKINYTKTPRISYVKPVAVTVVGSQDAYDAWKAEAAELKALKATKAKLVRQLKNGK